MADRYLTSKIWFQLMALVLVWFERFDWSLYVGVDVVGFDA